MVGNVRWFPQYYLTLFFKNNLPELSEQVKHSASHWSNPWPFNWPQYVWLKVKHLEQSNNQAAIKSVACWWWRLEWWSAYVTLLKKKEWFVCELFRTTSFSQIVTAALCFQYPLPVTQPLSNSGVFYLLIWVELVEGVFICSQRLVYLTCSTCNLFSLVSLLSLLCVQMNDTQWQAGASGFVLAASERATFSKAAC